MNKYTYVFQDRQLENQYQFQKLKDIRKPIFICSAIGLFFISVIKMITDFTENNFSNWGVLLATQVYLILSLITVRWKPQTVQYCLVSLNYILLAYQYWITNTVSQESQQLFANNFTICNLIIILMVDLIQSIVLIITTFMIKLIITIMSDSNPQYNVYFATILLMGYLSYCIKKLNFESRSFFLLSLKDNLWEKILPIIVNKSFILCQFDQQQFSFSYIQSQKLDFECTSNIQLKQFLREWTYKSQTLEEIFYKEIKQRQIQDVKQNSKTISIVKEKKQHMQITYCIFNYQHPTFLIKIENNLKIQENIKTLLCKTFEDKIEVQFKLFKSIVKNLSLSLQQGDNSQLFILRLYCFKQLLNYKIVNNQFRQKKLDVFQICEILKNLFSFKRVDYQITRPQKAKFVNVKAYFTRLLYEVFNCCDNNSTVVVNIDIQIYIRYVGKNIETTYDAVLQKVSSALVKGFSKVEINHKFHRILMLHEEPNQPFSSSYFT